MNLVIELRYLDGEKFPLTKQFAEEKGMPYGIEIIYAKGQIELVKLGYKLEEFIECPIVIDNLILIGFKIENEIIEVKVSEVSDKIWRMIRTIKFDAKTNGPATKDSEDYILFIIEFLAVISKGSPILHSYNEQKVIKNTNLNISKQDFDNALNELKLEIVLLATNSFVAKIYNVNSIDEYFVDAIAAIFGKNEIEMKITEITVTDNTLLVHFGCNRILESGGIKNYLLSKAHRHFSRRDYFKYKLVGSHGFSFIGLHAFN